MKIKLFFILFSIIILSNVLISAASDSTPCSPSIQMVNQDPSPAIPDGYVKVTFEITGLDHCKGFAVKLNPEYPFSLDTNETSFFSISENPYSAGYSNAWMVPYKIRVASDAFDGDYFLKLDYHEGTDSYFNSYSENQFNITIKDARTKFDAVIQETTGSEVSIAIANVGKYTANSVVVRIPEQDSFSVSGTDGQMVGNLASGDYSIVGFSINSKQKAMFNKNSSKNDIPSPEFSNGSIGSNNLKFDVYYTDNLGERRVVNMQLPLRLSSSNYTLSTGFNRTQNSSSFTSSWTFWIGLIVLFAIIGFVYFKFRKKIILVFNKFSFSKNKDSQRVGGKIPDWVKNAKEKEKK